MYTRFCTFISHNNESKRSIWWQSIKTMLIINSSSRCPKSLDLYSCHDYVKVNTAELKDGLLTISCERIVPEHNKKKLIEIK